jgi:hypothetical protein
MVTNETHLYGFDLVQDAWTAVRKGDAEGALLLPVVAIVFFVPVLCLRLREQRQALAHFTGALVSEYVLFCTSCATLFRRWRSGTLFTRTA